MSAGDPLDQLRARWHETDDARRAAVVHAGAMDRARRTRQRPAWLATLDQGWHDGFADVGTIGRRTLTLLAVLALLLAVLVAGLVVGSRPSLDAGRFHSAGTMTAERSWAFSVTPLADGRVLVVGGFGPYPNGTPVHPAEVWDPTTGTVSSTGAPADARGLHTATLLADGRVLVTGGQMYASGGRTGDDRDDDGEIPGATAEIWDPGTGLFTPTGSMASGRTRHSATLLEDDRVLIVGGEGLDEGHLGAELWDPATGSFRSLPSPSAALGDHTATRLQDGRVLIVGGRSSQASQIQQPFAELWDPKDEAFRPTQPPTHARSGHAARLLADGRVLIVGGHDDATGSVGPAEVWDPHTERFAVAAALPHEAESSSLAMLKDGRVLVIHPSEDDPAGGVTGTSFAEVWDPESGELAPAGALSSPRVGGRATVLPDGAVLLLGGELPPVARDPATCVKERGRCAVVEVGDLDVELWTQSNP